ncbi:uncharacterized protein LOC106668836 [Cimex lectularius]|uniref:FAS1 domain-containing protein n=1 Tax=Cimex lectularius TaxID=79782 RepID=A0A8I6TJ03_CIMLE|nr:uncharacterized protein LOC106668836 [Cimex lectularius]
MSFGGFLLLLLAASASAITNSQEAQHYSQLQYQPYQEQLNRGVLSPQEQSHILSDVQQHRFLVQQERPRTQPNYQRPPPPPQPPVSFSAPSFPQQYQSDSFSFSHYQPQYQPERKPILLKPTYPQDHKPTFTPTPPKSQNFHQQDYQPTYHSNSQAPIQQAQPSFQQSQTFSQFHQPPFQSFENNYVLTSENPQHQQFLTEVSQHQAKPDAYTPKPQQQETPSWILETQPPTPYKKQKPYEAITFATESFKTSTPAPRVVKYRPRPVKQEDKYPSKEEPGEIYIKPDRKKLFDQLVGSPKPVTIKATTVKPTRSTTTTTTTTTPAPRILDEQYIQEQLQKQIQEQLSGKDDIFKTLKITLPGELSSDQIANLPNIALGDSVAQVPQLSSFPQNLFLANGQKVKIVAPGKASKKNIKTVVIQQTTTTTTPKPPAVLFEELTKGVLPPGADFEVIRQKQDGALERVGPIQNIPQKKVTFVILEEQPDGSVKVQGVRGNEDGPTDTKGEEVESIIERLKKGEIKLPPSSKLSRPVANSTPQESQPSPSYVKHVEKSPSKPTAAPKRKSTTRSPVYVHSTQVANSHAGPSLPVEEYKRVTTQAPRKPQYSSPNRVAAFLPTVSPQNDNSVSYSTSPSTTFLPPKYSVSTAYTTTPRPVYTTPGPTASPIPSYVSTFPSQSASSQIYPSQVYANHELSSQYPNPEVPSHSYTNQELSSPVYSSNPPFTSSTPNAIQVLGETLKKNGLYAMAKFLKQSGLDTVLNETGPYTLFVPTDKAFRTLLVQLGGPDRAEIKFKENPRLLSGLLLHHVIPGAFKVNSLLDEMTGVSLAGTQLRVNTYTTQDNEWNDVKVVTINGAKINMDKSDIEVPQGIAHTVDRVMFPLPVGDVVQTLQADREGRFSKFIRLLQETGVAATLQGGKTYTVFAPTDAAFTDGELDKLLEQRGAARALALRHVTPGTLYSAGMLYYQLRDSMNNSNQIQLSKDAGRVKVNNAHVISRNIPATNGVIHAIDSLL